MNEIQKLKELLDKDPMDFLDRVDEAYSEEKDRRASQEEYRYEMKNE